MASTAEETSSTDDLRSAAMVLVMVAVSRSSRRSSMALSSSAWTDEAADTEADPPAPDEMVEVGTPLVGRRCADDKADRLEAAGRGLAQAPLPGEPIGWKSIR